MPRLTRQRGNETLRAIAFVSAILVFLHAALFPILMGSASIFFFGPPGGFSKLLNLLLLTGVLCFATLCISIRFYLSTCPPAD